MRFFEVMADTFVPKEVIFFTWSAFILSMFFLNVVFG